MNCIIITVKCTYLLTITKKRENMTLAQKQECVGSQGFTLDSRHQQCL